MHFIIKKLKRLFITNLALLVFLNLLIKPFWIFGIDRKVQNLVGAGEYGLYFALFNFSMLVNILLDLGLTNFNNRNISQNNHLITKHLNNIFVLKLMLGIIYLVICLVAAFILGYSMEQVNLLLFLVFNQFLISLTQYLRSNLSGLQYYKTDSVISVLDRTLMIIFCSILIWGNTFAQAFSIRLFVYAQTAAYMLTAAITFIIVLSKAGKFRPVFDLGFFIAILRQSYPYALLILLMAFYNKIDSVMIERLLPDGQYQAGIYAQGYRVLDAASMFAFLFASLLLPMFARMLKQKEPVGQLVQFSYTLIIVPAIILATASFVSRQEIIELLYNHHDEHSAIIFGILMIGFIGISTTYIFGTLLTANGNLRPLNIMAVTGMVLNIGLNLIMIPRFGALGAAVTGMITQIYTAVFQIWLSVKIFHFSISYLNILKMTSFTVVIVIMGFLSRLMPFAWMTDMLIFSVSALMIAFIIKLIKPVEIWKLIRNG